MKQGVPLKDKAKIHMLAEIIKDMSLSESFLDTFADSLEKSQKKKILLKNFDEIMKGLELGLGTRIAIALSLAISIDEAVKQKGISYLKLRLKEYIESDKSAEMPDYLVLSVTRFIYSCDQQGQFADELKFWTDYNQGSFKNSLNQPLGLISTLNDSSSIDIGKSSSLDLGDLDFGPKLKDLIFEVGPLATSDEQRLTQIIGEVTKLTERDIMDTIIMMVENSPFVESESTNKELSRLAKHAFLETIRTNRFDNPDNAVPAASFEQKPITQWNYSIFVKVISETKKVNWLSVLKAIDNPDFQLTSKRSFQEFLQVCDLIKEFQKGHFPRELIVGKWEHIRAQLNFIHRFIEYGKTDISLYRDLKNKNLVDYDTTPSVRSTTGFINSGMEIWLFKDFVVRLIEMSESNHYATVKGYFE